MFARSSVAFMVVTVRDCGCFEGCIRDPEAVVVVEESEEGVADRD